MFVTNNTTDRIYLEGQAANSSLKNIHVPYACGFVMLMVFLCASVLSSSVLWALWKTRQLECPVYRLVAYLLLDEVFVRIFGSPLIVTSIFARRWLYGDFGCVFYAFLMTWLGVTATSLFTCVSVERYIIMCREDITHRITTKVVDAISLICYLHGFVWAFLPLVGVNRYVYEPSGISCTPNWSCDNVGYILGLVAVCVLIPVIVSVYCYSAIFHLVRQSRHDATAARINANVEKKVAVTLIVTMAAFLFAWTPYSVIGLYQAFGFGQEIRFSNELNLITLVTAKTAGLWNPLIFSINNKDVRAAISASLCRMKERLHVRIICWKWKQVPAD